jgi:hypothetical protein
MGTEPEHNPSWKRRSVSRIVEDDDGPDTYVGTSGVEGCGLFADRDFQVGETVVDYALFPEHWHALRYDQLSEEQIRKNWYAMLDGERCITSDRYSKFSYINHSRTPNCFWDLDHYRVTALHPLVDGEELFIDYRLEPRPNRGAYPEWI